MIETSLRPLKLDPRFISRANLEILLIPVVIVHVVGGFSVKGLGGYSPAKLVHIYNCGHRIITNAHLFILLGALIDKRIRSQFTESVVISHIFTA